MNKLILALVFSCFLIVAFSQRCTIGTGAACRQCECLAVATKCSACNRGYYLGTAAAATCTQLTTASNCLVSADTVGASATCQACATGFRVDAGACVACTLTNGVAGTIGCTSSSVAWATKCTAGNTIANCLGYSVCAATGTTGNTCYSCPFGYFKAADGSACTICATVTNCVATSPMGHTCSGGAAAATSFCDKCKVGFFGDNSATCTACAFAGTGATACPATAYITCTSALNARCSNCGLGKFADTTAQTCAACTSAVTNCDVTKLSCSSVANVACTACTAGQAVTNCLTFTTCAASGTTGNACASCAPGFWLEGATTAAVCTACTGTAITNCAVYACTAAGTRTCGTCEASYYGTGASCTKCTLTNCVAANVVSCDAGANSGIRCTSCDTTVTGVVSIPNCKWHSACGACTGTTITATNNAVCSTCNDGFWWDVSTYTCTACYSESSSLVGCVLTCSSATSNTCASCQSGYTLSTVTVTTGSAGATSPISTNYCTANSVAGGAAAKAANANFLFLSLSLILALLALMI